MGVGDVLGKITHGLQTAEHAIVNGLAHLFSKEHVDEALKIADTVAKIGEWVLPYVQELSMIVPGSPVSPALLAAAQAMDVKLEQILSQASSAQRDGTLVKLAGNAGLKAMEDALAKGEIDLGSIKIQVPEDFSKIPQAQVDTAVQSAYALYVAPYLQKLLDQPQAPAAPAK